MMISKIKQFSRMLHRFLQTDRRLEEIKLNQGRILTGMQTSDGNIPLWKREFKIFSQWGEDGIIQYLVNNLDITWHTFIEFGVEDFSESNCRFLMMKDQWHGFVIDGSTSNIAQLRDSYYYWQYRLNSKTAFITRENVAQLLDESGFEKDLGLLSLDIDGVDYHVLEALQEWKPAILIVEYNDAFGWRRPVSVPYDPAFARRQKHFSNQYWGANLPAFCYLAGNRGYALVGTNSVGSNAFFVRRELLNDAVREVELVSCVREATFRDSRDESGRLTFLAGASRSRAISNMNVIDVSLGETLKVSDLDV
jgi:hypothetical protein